jgi:hypothetical protein
MPSITVELTNTQLKGLEYAAVSPQDWADNALTNRARIAIDEIVNLYVQHCLDNNIAMPTSRDEMVEAAFDVGVVKTAAVRQAEAEAEAQAKAQTP